MRNSYPKTSHKLMLFFLLLFPTLAISQTLEMEFLIAGGQFTGDAVWDLDFDREGKLWACTERGDLFYYHEGEWTDVDIPILGSVNLFSMAFDQNDGIWLATLGFGIVHFDGAEWKSFTPDSTELLSDTYTVVEVDKMNRVWAGSTFFAAGLSGYDGEGWTVYTEENSDLANDWIGDIAIDQIATGIWIACESSTMNKLNGNNFVTYDLNDILGSVNAVKSLAVDHDDNVWIGTDGSGLFSFDNSNWSDYRDSTGNSKVFQLATDESGNIWYHDWNTSLNQFRPNESLHIYPASDTIPSRINAIAVDSSGYKYIVGNNGSFITKLKEETISTSTRQITAVDDVSASPVPSYSDVRIRFTYQSTGSMKYVLSDMSGKSVKSDMIQGVNDAYDFRIDLAHLAQGLYTVSILDGGQVIFSERVIKG